MIILKFMSKTLLQIHPGRSVNTISDVLFVFSDHSVTVVTYHLRCDWRLKNEQNIYHRCAKELVFRVLRILPSRDLFLTLVLFVMASQWAECPCMVLIFKQFPQEHETCVAKIKYVSIPVDLLVRLTKHFIFVSKLSPKKCGLGCESLRNEAQYKYQNLLKH